MIHCLTLADNVLPADFLQQQQQNCLLFIRDNPGEPVPETLTYYATLTILKFLKSTPNLSFQASNYTSML